MTTMMFSLAKHVNHDPQITPGRIDDVDSNDGDDDDDGVPTTLLVRVLNF